MIKNKLLPILGLMILKAVFLPMSWASEEEKMPIILNKLPMSFRTISIGSDVDSRSGSSMTNGDLLRSESSMTNGDLLRSESSMTNDSRSDLLRSESSMTNDSVDSVCSALSALTLGNAVTASSSLSIDSEGSVSGDNSFFDREVLKAQQSGRALFLKARRGVSEPLGAKRNAFSEFEIRGKKLNTIRVLIVDDIEHFHKILPLVLTKKFGINGSNITSVWSANEAVEQFKKDQGIYDLVLMDFSMPPGENGVWATKQIRKYEKKLIREYKKQLKDYNRAVIISNSTELTDEVREDFENAKVSAHCNKSEFSQSFAGALVFLNK